MKHLKIKYRSDVDGNGGYASGGAGGYASGWTGAMLAAGRLMMIKESKFRTLHHSARCFSAGVISSYSVAYVGFAIRWMTALPVACFSRSTDLTSRVCVAAGSLWWDDRSKPAPPQHKPLCLLLFFNQ